MFIVFNLTNVLTVLFLIFLEGFMSVDNALVLALMIRHLPITQRKKALTYGIFGAFGFRIAAVLVLNRILAMTWLKFAGGAYLIVLAIGHFLGRDDNSKKVQTIPMAFWLTVASVEIMDCAFSIDSIVASVSVSENYYIVLTGGVLGIVMMRFAAPVFLWLIDRFPKLERSAYLLILALGAKLISQGFGVFSAHAEFTFWMAIAACIGSAFIRPRRETCPT